MATSFIEYKEYGIWTYDSVLVIMIKYLCDEIEKTEPWLEEWYEELVVNGRGERTGWTSLSLNEILTDDLKRKQAIQIIEKIIDKLQKKGESISYEEINSYADRYPDLNKRDLFKWDTDLPTKIFIDGFKIVKLLLENKIQIKSSDKVDYWFGEIAWEEKRWRSNINISA